MLPEWLALPDDCVLPPSSAPLRAKRVLAITHLRHPVARALSYFRHWRDARHADPSREWAAAHDFGALARAEHGAASAPHARRVSNAMTRQLCGRAADEPACRAPASRLAAAKAHLATFDVVGLCEFYNVTVALLAARLGVRLPRAAGGGAAGAAAPHAEATRTRPADRGARVSADAWDAMAARNREDLALYDFAKELFVRAVMTSEAAQPPFVG